MKNSLKEYSRTTTKILTIAVVLLLLVNIGMLIYIFSGKDRPDRGRGRGPYDKMVKELNMTPEQKKHYDSLREMHFTTIRPLFDSMRNTRRALFNLMKEETLNDSLVNVYSSRITEKQTRADRLTLEHFRRVRSMFSGEQQLKFDEFIQKMMQSRGKRKDSSDKKR